MTIQENLLESPRERSGSKTSNRYDYQKNWAICKLLELHQSESDYLLILDLHDDVVVLDSSTTPKMADFFQIKTNEKGFWTLKDLIRKGKQNSKLGKLYHNIIKFRDNVHQVFFVSNAYYRIGLENSAKKSINQRLICLSDIIKKDRGRIIENLCSELKLDPEEIKHNMIFLKRSDLSINSHTQTTKGKISDFLEKNASECKYQLGIVYRTIFDEIRTKTNQEFDCNNFEELIKYKSISKKYFDSILNTIVTSFSKDSWAEVSQSLIDEGFPLSERKEMRLFWNRYTIERMNADDLNLQLIRKRIMDILDKSKTKTFNTCKELIDEILGIFKKEKDDFHVLYEEVYIKAIILMEYFSNEK